MNTLTSNKLLTISEVAKLCQVSDRTVRRWMAAGILLAVRIGNITRIRPEDFMAFLDDNRSGHQPIEHAPEAEP